MNRILITGAAGFAGGHLLDLLSGGGREIAAWHRPGGRPPREVPGTTWDAVDLLDRDAVAAAIARLRPSAVYHCAGAAHVGRAWHDTEATFAVNVRGTHHLLDALQRAGITARVLVHSSALVYASAAEPLRESHPLMPNGPYGVSKLAQEMLAQRTNGTVSVALARPFNHFGPRQDPHFVASGFARCIADIERGGSPPEISVGNLEARRDLTDVRDTVRAYQLILERGQAGRPYNVCSGRALLIRELLDMLLARARVPIAVKVDPARYRPNDTPLLVGDPGRLRDELGWTPTIPIEQTLDDLLAFWRSERQ
ncbi:MAG: GDP-mannose 4,6-dehydratase [Acidobacteria bacterium]|nr:GDP-mannose 4,6-dehydratase [Acidobacteriota bacterium]